MPPSTRAFVLRHTRLRPVPAPGGVRLHLADEALPLWHAVQLRDRRPGRRAAVLGVRLGRRPGDRALPAATTARSSPAGACSTSVPGSGLCAIAAMLAGAGSATAVDIDPFAIAAIGLNARANGTRISAVPARPARRRAARGRRHPRRRLLVRGRPGGARAAVASCGWPARAGSRSCSATRAAATSRRRPGGAGQLRGPDHDRARGPRAQEGRVFRLRAPAGGSGGVSPG